MSRPKNQILADDARASNNFYRSDRILRAYTGKHISPSALEYIEGKLDTLGKQAVGEMETLSRKADRQGPVLKRRDNLGERIDKVEFPPAYWELIDIAARSEIFYVKYESGLRSKFTGDRHALGFALGQLYAMSELGVYCPLCMTDGAAHLVDRFAPEALADRLLPKLSARTGSELYTGAMFITEKSGGSDVGRNLCTADRIDGDRYKLNGEKWFCSNVNADVIMTLARTGKTEEGTRGLSLFLVEKKREDGSVNPMRIHRLKEKLGVRSMATGEVEFDNTIGIRLGEEGGGFSLMAEMINISRVYNSVAALGGMRRALIEAYEYLNHRITFGKRAIEHPLIRRKFHELGSLYIADFLLVWRVIRAMDAADRGNERAQDLMRMAIPMAKWRSAGHAVYVVRECMELLGGNGYIEDFVMPRLLRDVNVLPIWEGSGNIIVLDILRADRKSEGMAEIVRQIGESAGKTGRFGSLMKERLQKLLEIRKQLAKVGDRDFVESSARPVFEEVIRLYQMALMIEEQGPDRWKWLDPALEYMASTFDHEPGLEEPAGVERIRDLIGWEY